MLNEEIIKKVRIFDFDDTLVKTDSNIYVTHASGKQTTLTPGEYAVYVEKPGDVFDFSDFEKVNKPELIKQNVRMLKQQAKEGKKIVILTARAKYEPIKRFFNELKLTPYVVALGDSNPQKKADYIEDLINKGYNDIAFIDDSLKNVQAVEGLRKKYPKVKLVLKHHINEMLGGATMNAQEMARHKKKLAKLKQYLKAQGDDMMEYPKDLPNTVFNAKLLTQEDLRAWFGKGGKGGVGGGGWDRYNSSGDRIGKCGDAKEGEAYSACLSKEKARKLGKAGRAAFVKRKRAAQGKGGDAKKGGERKKGQKPIKVKTGVNENTTNKLVLKRIGDNEYVVKAMKGGREVGKLNFIKSKFKPVLKATIVTVDPAHRRQGIGSSMYVYAEKELGMKFVKSDEVLTPDGKSIWNDPNRKFGLDKNMTEERLNLFLEKNIPTKPDKWAYAKAQAKKKFDVYPSAYANAWAAKKYKELGGKWRKSEAVLPDEADEEENFSNNRFHNFVSFSGPNPVAGYGAGPR